MTKKNSIVAIITARGGSKGLPGKNIRDVCGKPLIAYTIEAALTCRYIEACYVTTDDEAIKIVSQKYGAQVIDRPNHLATDTSLSQDAVLHALSKLSNDGKEPEFFALLQPTSPMRTAIHLNACMKDFFASEAICCSSVTVAEHHPLKMLILEHGKIRPLQDPRTLEAPRQLLPEAFRINGAIYIMSTAVFKNEKSFYVEPYMPFIMSSEDSLDIDTEKDIKLFEMQMRCR